MIAKNIKGKSFGGCVRYVMNDSSELLAAEGVFAKDSESVIRSFAVQRAGRPEILQPVGHIPLSFSTEDSPRLSNEFLIQLAGEYMKEMGIENTQYVIVRHHNTAHDHIHIIYNRIDNDLKLISVNHDYQRNVKTCKKLKDRHGLTYGEGKGKVNVKKLANPDKVKYEIYDAITDILPCCIDYHDLEEFLGDAGITVQYKLRRGTDQIEGVSFRKDDIAFKGSAVDRIFSHANLQKTFEENRQIQAAVVVPKDFDLSEYIPDMQEPIVPSQKVASATSSLEPVANTSHATQNDRQKPLARAKEKSSAISDFDISKYVDDPKPTVKSVSPVAPSPPHPAPTPSNPPKPTTRNPVIRGVELTDQQRDQLHRGESVFLENMVKDNGVYSAYVFLNDGKDRIFFSQENPDNFVKFGQYEMRLRDKRLIEAGNITRATVKWYGGGNYARPYLWKENPADTGYKESWDDPRKPKQNQPQIEIPQPPQSTTRFVPQQPHQQSVRQATQQKTDQIDTQPPVHKQASQPASQVVPKQPQSPQKPDQTEARKPWRPAPPKKKSGMKM